MMGDTEAALAAPPLPGQGWLEDGAGASDIAGRRCRAYVNKGSISNTVTFVVMATFIVLKAQHGNSSVIVDYGLSCGLFGFAGGATNWLVRARALPACTCTGHDLCSRPSLSCGGVADALARSMLCRLLACMQAVHMLFERVPGLVGSGVIPRHFVEVRKAVKAMCIQMFFQEPALRGYIDQHSDKILAALDLPGMLRGALAAPTLEVTLERSLTAVRKTDAISRSRSVDKKCHKHPARSGRFFLLSAGGAPRGCHDQDGGTHDGRHPGPGAEDQAHDRELCGRAGERAADTGDGEQQHGCPAQPKSAPPN
jgi:hypothetical protein